MNSIEDKLVKHIDAKTAFSLLSNDENTYLIDVRTEQEWKESGIPDLSPNPGKLHKISWRLLPNMNINPEFGSKLQESVPNKNATLLFICRSGVRSNESANVSLNQFGYHDCMNIIGGFDGVPKSCWKDSELPWRMQ